MVVAVACLFWLYAVSENSIGYCRRNVLCIPNQIVTEPINDYMVCVSCLYLFNDERGLLNVCLGDRLD